MNQLEEIIAILSSGDEGTTNALLKTKVLMYAIGKKELAAWVNHELTGYPDDVPLPDYRTLAARILANINNGMRSYTAYQLPILYLDDVAYEHATTSRVRLSISQIEQLVVNAGDDDSLQQPIPLDYAYLKYRKHIDDDYEITRCYKEIALHNFTNILTQVRSRLLDFVLELTEYASGTPGAKTMTEKLKNVDAATLFKSAIFGDNTVINLGDSSSFNITNNVIKNDIVALKRHLESEGVSSNDVTELEVAINSDGPIAPRSKNYGPAVGQWFSGMISKAANSSAGIGVATITELLSSALKKYYNLD
ncbi:hypothetical protein M2371_002188 [Buttiauxella sp. BIGb0471]|uniref:AbiTii domain-containing protein n=1 Tax=Buttiauxella sp. BIGb0471 TaxID=2940597 RepID=UPI00216A0FA6|nr:hypothetical protein [Buttiauxella sp. BIGb0471]MCS3602965.1 hypothetical protein [Buttiauxella sp. BIGb0471]